MKIFKDSDIVSKSLEIWIQYANVHCFSENHVTSINEFAVNDISSKQQNFIPSNNVARVTKMQGPNKPFQ